MTTSNRLTIGTALVLALVSSAAISAIGVSTGTVITSVVITSRTCHCGMVLLLSGAWTSGTCNPVASGVTGGV